MNSQSKTVHSIPEESLSDVKKTEGGPVTGQLPKKNTGGGYPLWKEETLC